MSYTGYGNRYVGNAEIEDSATHKLKATYWEAKHKIMSKIGKGDDEHLQASDAELDAKIEVLKSVQRTTDRLMRLVNEYEFVMFALAKSEYSFSRFLKTQSEVDKTRAGKIMLAVSRVENFSSQQRLGLRQPLERLYQECETFRLRAVTDTAANLDRMETARNDYRAALMWMKDVSEELDPDTQRQLEKFRKVQAQVRKKKDNFDRLKLDVMQKVDMLAASRANMFSRALEFYQKWSLEYWAKSAKTLEVVSKGFAGMYQFYEFNVIKDLQEPTSAKEINDEQTLTVIKELEDAIKEFTKSKEKISLKVNREYDRQRNGENEGIDLLADFGSDEENRHDDKLILAEDKEENSQRKEKEEQDLMSSDFFDIEKTDGAMAALQKRQRERTAGSGDPDEQLLSLAGMMENPSDTSHSGQDELKLLDDLLNVMNQAVDGDGHGNLPETLSDLKLDCSWQSDTGHNRSVGSDLDFLRPAEAQALLPSQLLEMNSGRPNQFSIPFGPFGNVSGDQGKSTSFYMQEQQRSGLLLGPPTAGKVVSNPDKNPPKSDEAKKTSAGSRFDLFADLDPFANPDAIGKKKQSNDGDDGGGEL